MFSGFRSGFGFSLCRVGSVFSDGSDPVDFRIDPKLCWWVTGVVGRKSVLRCFSGSNPESVFLSAGSDPFFFWRTGSGRFQTGYETL